MSMLKRAWSLASVIAALAAVVVAVMMSGLAARLMGALVIVIGLMPLAMLLASIPGRRRVAGVAHVVAGALFALTGLVLASQDTFLPLLMNSMAWRVLARSGGGLASVGWVTIGAALALTGTALLRSRRGPAVLSSLLVTLTSGYFAVTLVLVPYLSLRRYGATRLDWQAVLVAILLVLAALLQVIAVLSRIPVTWTPTIPDPSLSTPTPYGDATHAHAAIEVRPRQRWKKRVLLSAVGGAAIAGICAWAWLLFSPRLVLAEVFTDPRLSTCVAQELGPRGPSAKVSRQALNTVRSLACNGDRVESFVTGGAGAPDPLAYGDRSMIRSIRGLESLPNLASLDLPNNGITDLTPLADLQKLASIKLTNNQVTDLTPLAGLPVLNDLGLSGNTITDLKPLAHVATIRSLGLSRNQISNLTPLTALTGLTTLDVSENRVTNVAPLAHLKQLSRLTLAGNRISSPAPLNDLPSLSMLDIAGNRISDAATFAGFPALEELWVGRNLLTDVTPLVDLPSLTGVDLEGADLDRTVGLDALKARNIYVGMKGH